MVIACALRQVPQQVKNLNITLFRQLGRWVQCYTRYFRNFLSTIQQAQQALVQWRCIPSILYLFAYVNCICFHLDLKLLMRLTFWEEKIRKVYSMLIHTFHVSSSPFRGQRLYTLSCRRIIIPNIRICMIFIHIVFRWYWGILIPIVCKLRLIL